MGEPHLVSSMTLEGGHDPVASLCSQQRCAMAMSSPCSAAMAHRFLALEAKKACYNLQYKRSDEQQLDAAIAIADLATTTA